MNPTREGLVANCSILFTEHPVLDRPRLARACGFTDVEYWWPFSGPVPPDAEIDAFVNAINDAGVNLLGLNFYGGERENGDRGVMSIPSRVHEFRATIEAAVEVGGRLGCKNFNALYGNRVDEISIEDQDELAVAEIANAASALKAIGAVVLIEPLSAVPTYPILTINDSVAVVNRVIRETGADNVLVLADLYHVAVNGDDVETAIDEHCSLFGHVQIADAPGRHHPGTGNLPIIQWIDQLRERGYGGPISLEYEAIGPSEDSFSWLETDDWKRAISAR